MWQVSEHSFVLNSFYFDRKPLSDELSVSVTAPLVGELQMDLTALYNETAAS